MTPVFQFIESSFERYLQELGEYLAIPSVSALSEHRGDLRRCAAWTADAMSQAGLQNVRVLETPGNPIVYGDWLRAPRAPTILVYGHYDVQPADPLELWDSPPFEAAVRNGRIHARGATDDKGQLFMHLKAIEACLTAGGRLPVNLKMIVEGEEEVGGANLAGFVQRHGEMLAADVVIDSDSAMFAPGVPSISYALRGLACFQLDVRGAAIDLHSGSFGGAVANPALVLAGILSGMRDADGRVTIPGFYDDVKALTPGERVEFAQLPFDEEEYARSIGVPALFGERGYTTLERIWARPTLEINGLLSGFTGEGVKTVIPAVATAKISMRLVPDQMPGRIAELFEAYLATVTPKTVHHQVTRMHDGEPWLTRVDSPWMQAAARAMERGFGTRPAFIREGGSNSITSVFAEALGVPTVMFGIGLPADNAHAPNESLDLEQLRRGIIATVHLYDEIARETCRSALSPSR